MKIPQVINEYSTSFWRIPHAMRTNYYCGDHCRVTRLETSICKICHLDNLSFLIRRQFQKLENLKNIRRKKRKKKWFVLFCSIYVFVVVWFDILTCTGQHITSGTRGLNSSCNRSQFVRWQAIFLSLQKVKVILTVMKPLNPL